MSNIVKEFEKLTLVNPGVDFTLIHNDNTMYQLRGGNFKQRILALFGRALESQLIPITIDTSIVKIEGFICRPENVRRRNFLQYLFVNGRYMRHPYFHKAVLSSYEQLIPDGTQPNYFLSFSVEPETIDVNIHPTKTEIKFENEMPIWQILSAAVKESLGRFSVAPTIDFDTEGAPDIPVFKQGDTDVTAPKLDIDPDYNPFETNQKPQKAVAGNTNDSWTPKPHPAMDWEKLYSNFESSKLKGIESMEVAPETDESAWNQQVIQVEGTNANEVSASTILQVNGKYIITAIKTGLMLIDQHRAHMKVLYDKYIKQMSGHSVVSQSILFPEVLHLTPAQHLILQELQEEIEKIGFNLSDLGGNDWSVSGGPAGTDGIDVKDLLLQVIDSIIEGGDSISSRINEHIAQTVAERAAIPYGRILSQDEMERLISDLLRLPQPNYTPAGKTVICKMSIEQIARMFN